MIHPLAAAVEEVATGIEVEERQDTRLQGLPPPMVPGVHDRAPSSCYMQEEFKLLIKNAQGFEYRPEHPEAPTIPQHKWGWSGLQPGDWAELEVNTEQSGEVSTKSSAEVGLVHLTSYRNVGSADVSCVSGCTCQPTHINARGPTGSTVLRMRWMPVTPHPRCRLRVEIVSEQTSDAQHKFMLAAIMVWTLE